MQGEDGCRIRLSADCRPLRNAYEGKYYAYGTGGTVEGEGFACFSSDDLKTGRVKARRCRPQIPTVRGDSGAGGLLHRIEKEVLSVLLHRGAYLRGNGRCSPRPVPSGSEAADMG